MKDPNRTPHSTPPATPAGGLRAQKKLQARTGILRSTRALVARQGYGIRMRDIARAAGVSYQTLYNYFPTKAQLFQALLDDEADRPASDRSEDIAAGYEGDLLNTLIALSGALFQHIEDSDRHLWRVAIRDRTAPDVTGTPEVVETPGSSDPAHRTPLVLEPAVRETLRRLLSDARASGELATEVPASRLADFLGELIDYHLLRFVLDGESTLASASAALDAQLKLLVSPFLTPPATDTTDPPHPSTTRSFNRHRDTP